MILEPSHEAMASSSLATTVGVSVAVALLFSAVGFTVGVVITTLYWSKRIRPKTTATPQIGQGVTLSSVDTEVKAIPEYEEISVSGAKRGDIQLTDNAAYGCKSLS